MRPNKEASYVKAGFYSALFTMYGGALYFLFSLAFAVAEGGDLGKVVVDTLVGGFVCWLFGTFIFYEIGKAFDELNAAGRRRDDPPAGPDSDDKNQPGC